MIHDAFRRTVSYGSPFYESAGLLRPGLVDYAFAAGVLRTGLLTAADRFGGGLAVTARFARGISNNLTADAQFESGRGGANGGILLNSSLGSAAVHIALLRAATIYFAHTWRAPIRTCLNARAISG